MGRTENRILLVGGHGEGDHGEVSGLCREDRMARDFTRRLKNSLKKSGMRVASYPASRDIYYRCKIGEEPEFEKFAYVLEIHFHGRKAGEENGAAFGVRDREEPHIVERAVIGELRKEGIPVREAGIGEERGLLTANLCERVNVAYALLKLPLPQSPEEMKRYRKTRRACVRAVCLGMQKSLSLCEENLKSI